MMTINIMFMSLLIMSTMIVLSSPSWFCMWLGIEMNTMAFVPMLYQNNNKLTSESALKYFLVQTFASTIMFLALSTMIKMLPLNINSSTIMTLAMSMKVGAAPFHMWYPPVAEGLMWSQNMLLMTWQKIAPMSIMFLTTTSLVMMITITSLMTGSIKAFNQTSLRKLMAYSSITHMGWMFSSMMIKSNTWMMYMIIYFTTTMIMMLSLWFMNIYYISQMYQMNNPFMLLSINLLSMGGFPPLLGFAGKWMILNDMINHNIIMLSFLLILSSCINLYIYIRIIHPIIHMNSTMMKTNITWFKTPLIISTMTMVSLSSLPIMMM